MGKGHLVPQLRRGGGCEDIKEERRDVLFGRIIIAEFLSVFRPLDSDRFSSCLRFCF